MLASDLRSEGRWLSSGFLLMFSSGFGQTYYIALFAGYMSSELALSSGQFGSAYTAATLASASLLIWAGRVADNLPIRWLGAGVLAALALTAFGVAGTTSVWSLTLTLFGLRFFGQGMLTHVAMTAVARWFVRKRGRAIAVAALGLPASETLLPIAAVAAVGLIGWRATWFATGCALALLAVPAFIVLLKHERKPAATATDPSADSNSGPVIHQWTRSEVLRSPMFYALMPVILAHPFVVTGVFFNQVAIVESKGWQLTWWAAGFPALAAAHVLSGLATGWLVDRIGSRRLLPLLLLPLGIGILVLTFGSAAWVLPLFMVLTGTTQGGLSTAGNALWPELYGTLHLGAIRGLIVAVIVLSTALAPGVSGLLLDSGVALDTQLLTMAIYCLAAAAWMTMLAPRLRHYAVAKQN